jgi:hypothetical protein
MATQHEYKFCNETSIIGDNNTLTRGDVDFRTNAATNKTAWGVSIPAQIGGMCFKATVTRNLTQDMSAEIHLATHSTNTLTSGNYLASLSIPANAANGFEAKTVLPHGLQRAAYLGVVVVGTGNIAAGNVTVSLLPHSGQVID